jgi:hypothetical protein
VSQREYRAHVERTFCGSVITRLEEGDAGLEDVDLQPLDDAGEAAGAREHRRAFGNDGGDARGEAPQIM